MLFLRQSTAVVVSFGSFVLNSDAVTLVTNLVGTGANQTESTTTGIRIGKNGGALAARHATATASTYDANGEYLVTLDTTDTNTLGVLVMSYVNGAAFCPVRSEFMVVPANVWDSLFGATLLKVDVDTIKTNPVVNAGTITFPTTATLASTVNITAGTITTVTTTTTATNLTNAPTNGDLTATMKTSVITAATAATPTIAGYTGNTPQTGDSYARIGALGAGLTAVDDAVISALSTIQADTDDIQARLPAALTGAGNMKTDALALNGSTTAADNLKAGALGLVPSTCAVGSTTTSIVTNLAEATNDHYNGRVITFTSGALLGQTSSISAYNGGTKTLTVVALTEAPANTDSFVIS